MMSPHADGKTIAKFRALRLLLLVCALGAQAGRGDTQGTASDAAPQATARTSRATDETASCKPHPVPKNGTLALWRLPYQRLVVLTDDPQRPVVALSTASVQPRSFVERISDGQGNRRDALAVHGFRPWQVVPGSPRTVLVEFPLQLPDAPPVQFRAALAFLNPFGRGADQSLSKPVVWRARVRPYEGPVGELGPILFEWHSNQTAWQEVVVDLGDFAGRAIWLQLDNPPDRGKSHLYWVEPTLTCGAP